MRIGIVKDSGCSEIRWSIDWEKMCQERGIEYQVFDSCKDRFVLQVLEYQPDIVFWRSGHMYGMKEKDNMQRQFLEDCGVLLVPDWNVHKYYDNKVIQTYLFQKKGYPHPETHIFFNKKEAMEFVIGNQNFIPVVVKANKGAGSYTTRFCFTIEEVLKEIEEKFEYGVKYLRNSEDREKGIFYCQKYIRADGIFRVVMVGTEVAYSFYQSNRPGTLVASSQGFDSYPETPIELLELCQKINKEMGWQYMMYDLIYDSVKKEWLILEITDTCGQRHSAGRKYTYYYENKEWIKKEDNSSPQKLVFEYMIKVLTNKKNSDIKKERGERDVKICKK